ncbi:aminotransferase class I/II-fold pyridoxal phosphate-dependent enzyme [Hydrogenimonas sp.]
MKRFEYFSTLLPQLAGEKEGPVAPPVVSSAAFGYASAQEAEAIFAGEVQKPFYARMGNPTGARLEKALAAMEGGAGAVVTASGMGAIAMAVTAFCEAGDTILGVGGFFGGTYALMNETLPRLGIEARFCDVDDFARIEESLREGVKLVLVESVGNPNLKLPDLAKLGRLCREYETLLAVDNTLTPLVVQPLKTGADLVLYSTTKIISGHSAALGGAVVFRGVGGEGEKLLSARYASLRPLLEKGKGAIGAILKKRAMRDFGMSANAFASFLTLLGLETLPLRMRRVNESTAKLAGLLHAERVRVRHPSLEGHEHHLRYEAHFPDGCGPLLTVECGTRARAFAFLNESKLLTQTANVGDNRTLGLHMASTIYRDFDELDRKILGITEGLVRISVGLESPVALAEDMLEAWKKAMALK